MRELLDQTLLGRYHVQDVIGFGGMAQVFKVWDKKRAAHLAMKLLREDLAQDRLFIRRFQREAETLRKLQHPNIVRFYGLEQDGLLAFMLMDYVEGSTLRSEIFELDGKPMNAERILEIMRPLCSALHFAHSQGMVHCDLKPGNVMIHKNGTVLVTDFGIARMTDAATATMVGMGTPAYMAPEMVRGDDPSPATDIYALGVCLFEMVTGGERPFSGERATTTGSTAEKVRWEQAHLEPPSPRQWNPSIPPKLERIVMRCLEKAPGNRIGGAFELLNQLELAIVGAESPLAKAARAKPAPKATPKPKRAKKRTPVEEPAVSPAAPKPGKAPTPSPDAAAARKGFPLWVIAILVAVCLAVGGTVAGLAIHRANVEREIATAQANADATAWARRTATARAEATSVARAQATATARAQATAAALASMVGDWTLYYSWGCDGDYGDTKLTLSADYSFETESGNDGGWSLEGSTFYLHYTSGTEYEGQLNQGGLEGTMVGQAGGTGCWYARSLADEYLSIVGEWTLEYDWDCSGDPHDVIWTLFEDFTFTTSSGYEGTWSMDGDEVTLIYTSGTTYVGEVTQEGMEGTMGSEGCWSATRSR
ncbi:MAG: protein kinase [Anaerolineales bacterium]